LYSQIDHTKPDGTTEDISRLLNNADDYYKFMMNYSRFHPLNKK